MAGRTEPELFFEPVAHPGGGWGSGVLLVGLKRSGWVSEASTLAGLSALL